MYGSVYVFPLSVHLDSRHLLIIWQIAGERDDGREAEEEHETVQLQGLEGHACGRARLPHLVHEQAEPEHTGESTIRLSVEDAEDGSVIDSIHM